MNAWTGLVVTAAVVSVLGSVCQPRRVGGSGGVAAGAAAGSASGAAAAPSSASCATSRARPVAGADRVGRRPAHRHQRDRRAGPVRVQRAAGRRLSRSRPPDRVTSRPAACSCWRDPAPTAPGRSSLKAQSPRAVDPPSGAQAGARCPGRGLHRQHRHRTRRRAAGRRRRPHDHSEVAWRLKHLKRSVLKEATDRACLRRRRRPRRVRPRGGGLVHAPDRPGAGRGEPADRLPARRPGQPAHDRRVRQPAAARLGRSRWRAAWPRCRSGRRPGRAATGRCRAR